jgi:formylglycine-generating enzyme required for sulfatase activity
MPMNHVWRAEVYAFCIWDGGFIPTEAELEYAQAGGPQQRKYPWGSSDPGATTDYAIWGCYYPGDGACGVAPVGSAVAGAGLFGQLDLVGNVYQITLDDCSNNGFVDPCDDCVFLGADGSSLIRIKGGSYRGDGRFNPFMLSGGPGDCDVVGPENYTGFRCARTP